MCHIFNAIYKIVRNSALVLLLSGCAGSLPEENFKTVENCLNAYPDSALTLLKRMDYDELSISRQSKYALLYSEINERIGEKMPDIIKPASDYYREHGSECERMKALYFVALHYLECDSVNKAVNALLKAQVLSVDLESDVFKEKILKKIDECVLVAKGDVGVIKAQNQFLVEEIAARSKLNDVIHEQYGLAIVLFALLCIAAMAYIRSGIRIREREFDEAILSLQNCYRETDAEKRTVIETLIQDKFKVLNSICSNLSFNECDDEFNKREAYKEIKAIINRYGENLKCISELEGMVNRYNDNVMEKLRKDFPSLSEIEFRQFCYHCVGFSGKLISMFLKEPLNTTYSRKSRLKKKIQSSGNCNSDVYLSYLR